MSTSSSERRLAFALVAPAATLMLVVTGYPIGYAMWLSLQRNSLATPNAGLVQFGTGTLNLTGTYNVSGATSISTGTTNFVTPVSITSTGPVTISGGVLNFSTGNPVTVPNMTLGNGILAGPTH